MKYETHSADQFMHWRHTWRVWHDETTVSEFEALEYKPGPMTDHARNHASAFNWAGDVPWAAEVIADHSATPVWPGHQPVPGHCALLNIDACYYTLGNVAAADALLAVWIDDGNDDECIWTALLARNPLVTR